MDHARSQGAGSGGLLSGLHQHRQHKIMRVKEDNSSIGNHLVLEVLHQQADEAEILLSPQPVYVQS